jgi:hypothetical protein
MGLTRTSAAKRFFRMAKEDYKNGQKGAAAAEALAGAGLFALEIMKQLNNH